MCVYLGAKFQDPSIILTSFRQAVILHPPPSHLKTDLLKSPPRLGLNGYTITHPNLCVLIKILLAVSQFTGPLGKSFSKLAKICFRQKQYFLVKLRKSLCTSSFERTCNKLHKSKRDLGKEIELQSLLAVFLKLFLLMELVFNFVLIYHGITYEHCFLYIHGNTFEHCFLLIHYVFCLILP